MNNNVIYTLEKEITSVDVDFNLDQKLSSLFLYFQESSSIHSEILNIGKSNTIDKDLHWVITRFNVEVIKMPKYGDKVKVITYPSGNNLIFFYRHFMITDLSDNVLVKASSIWCIVDGKTHTIKKNPFGDIKIPEMHLDNELTIPNKIEEEDSSFIYSRSISYSDIDLNNHLNNTRYIELIQDAFDLNFYRNFFIKDFSINYMAELKAGDKVEIYKSKNNPYIVSGKKDNKTHFVAKLDFINK